MDVRYWLVLAAFVMAALWVWNNYGRRVANG